MLKCIIDLLNKIRYHHMNHKGEFIHGGFAAGFTCRFMQVNSTADYSTRHPEGILQI